MMLVANCGALVTALLGCLGIGCLVAQSPSAFTVVGAAWCAAAAARVLSLAVDGSRSWQNVVGILFEASVGGAMLAAML